MKYARLSLVILLIFLGTSKHLQAQNEKEEVIQIAHDFFHALEKGDTIAYRALFQPDAMIFTVREKAGQTITNSRPPANDKFQPGTVIKERMKDTGISVQVHGNMATVWAPYNLWINDAFSHCGVDVFTLIKTSVGWRIATLSYTIEKEGCDWP